LVVQFQPKPLFNQTSFLPGDTVTGSATVTNNSGQTQMIDTQAVNVTDNDGLGGVMHLEIKEGDNALFSGTLSGFFNAGQIHLSDLANGATTIYNYSITFNLDAGDEYQGKGLGFDINVGFFGEESVGTEISTGGGGGGGGYTSDNLIIFHEAIGGIGPTSVTITWETNLPASSRVIYSPSPAPAFNISNPPNYGYTYSTIDDLNKVTTHSVTINGLLPATVYFFRCISHASPDTLSPEFSFTTLGPGQAAITETTPLQQGEVLGEATIRTGLPETGGILGKIAKKESKINLFIAGGLIAIWIGLFLIRRSIHPVK